MVEVAAARPEAAASAGWEPKPEFEVTGGNGRLSVASVREVWMFRSVLAAFVSRQLRVRYKQAALGVGWAILQPVAAAAIFALFIGRFAHVASEGRPYVVFALAGTAVWTFFSSAVGGAMESIVTDQAILRKVYFPREIFPLASLLAALVDLAAGLVTVVSAVLIAGIRPELTWLALPVPILLAAVSALALGTALSALNVYYRDVRYVLPFFLQLGMFATPVIWSLSTIPGRWRGVFETLNPLAAAVDSLRRIVLHGLWPSPGVTLAALGWSVGLAWLSLALFKRLERSFSDRI